MPVATHLLVELADIVVGLVLSLNKSRVLLNVLCGGHLECEGGKKKSLVRT